MNRPALGQGLGIAIAVLAAGCALTIAAPRFASALPGYTSRTGKVCGACHTDPAGGGPLTPLGDAFVANGRKLPTTK
jgi:mono/diheme cytochrome c family protein